VSYRLDHWPPETAGQEAQFRNLAGSHRLGVPEKGKFMRHDMPACFVVSAQSAYPTGAPRDRQAQAYPDGARVIGQSDEHESARALLPLTRTAAPGQISTRPALLGGAPCRPVPG
jgi:hypothetical protein